MKESMQIMHIRKLSTVVFVHAIYHVIGGGWSLPPERRKIEQ